MSTNQFDDWRYRDLRERIEEVNKAWQRRMDEVIAGSVKRLDRMDADLENLERENTKTFSKLNETMAGLMAEMKGIQTHIQNRLLWSVTGATVITSLLSGFAGHIFFR